MPRAGAVLSQARAVPSPGSGVSQDKEYSEDQQYQAVSLGFPVLPLILSTLNTRLCQGFTAPLCICPAFPPPDLPLGAQTRQEEDGEWRKGHPRLSVPSAAGIRLSLTWALTGSVRADKGVLAGCVEAVLLSTTWTQPSRAPSGHAVCYSAPSKED